MRAWRRSLPLALVLLGLCACGGPSSFPENAYYRLSAPAAASALPASWVEGVLRVEPLSAEGVLRERAIAYQPVGDPGTLRQYHYHYWNQTPPRLLQSQLVRFLRARGAATLVTLDTQDEADLIVGGRILDWERVLGPDDIGVRLELELWVRRRGAGEPVLLRVYNAGQSVPDERMSSTVSAFDTALAGVLQRFLIEADLALRASAVAPSDRPSGR